MILVECKKHGSVSHLPSDYLESSMPSQINLDGWNHPNLFVMAAPSVHRLSLDNLHIFW